MSHLCDSKVDGPTARRDNVLANKCEYPPFCYPLLYVPDKIEATERLSGTSSATNINEQDAADSNRGAANLCHSEEKT